MSFPDAPRLSDSIASKLVTGGVPLNGQTIQFNSITNQWEFVVAGGLWELLGEVTLAAASGTVEVTGIARRDLNWIEFLLIPNGADTPNPVGRFNADAAANYGGRSSDNSAGAAATVNRTSMFMAVGAANRRFRGNMWFDNIAALEKNMNSHLRTFSPLGAAAAPDWREAVWHWVNVIDAVDRFAMLDFAGTQQYAIGSWMRWFGRNYP